MDARPARVVVLTQHVAHYHAARYAAAKRNFERFSIFSVLNTADYAGLLSDESADITRIFDGQTAYVRATASGDLWRALHAKLDQHRPQVVAVAGWGFPESIAAIAWARASGSRVALISESQAHDAPRSWWREAIKKRVVLACDSALVSARPHRYYVRGLGIPTERIFYGTNAVDNDYFARHADAARENNHAVRGELGLPPRYFLASARFIPKKNFPVLVEAFALALGSHDAGHDLVILGDGPERPRIQEAMRAHGIAHRVHLPGFQPYEALPRYYGLAEAFVHVPTVEQWGLVVNEAAASGLPLVISAPCGASAALMHADVNGYRVDADDVRGIANAIASLMRMPPGDRLAMGAASRRIAAEWGPERFASGLLAACEAALTTPARTLGMGDRLLFRALSRIRFERVR